MEVKLDQSYNEKIKVYSDGSAIQGGGTKLLSIEIVDKDGNKPDLVKKVSANEKNIKKNFDKKKK